MWAWVVCAGYLEDDSFGQMEFSAKFMGTILNLMLGCNVLPLHR
jgi:hypothetical protein